MKAITLIKPCTAINVAHLYEHIWCRALITFLEDQNLLDTIDYHIDARTYHGGFVYVNLLAYTPEAEQVLGRVPHIKAEFSDDFINGAATQVIAEEKAEASWDERDLRKRLQQLQDRPWQSIEDIEVFDSAQLRRSYRAFRLHDTPKRTFGTLTCRLALNTDFAAKRRRWAIPLFYWLSQVLLQNVDDILTNDYWYFRSGTGFQAKSGRVARTHTFHVYRPSTGHLTDELQACRDLVAYLVSKEVLAKSLHFLQQARFDQLFLAPDDIMLYEATGILIGAAGWRKIATEENVREVLLQTTMQLAFGREKQEFSVGELLGSKNDDGRKPTHS